MERWTKAVIRLRWLAIGGSILTLAVSLLAMAGLSDLLTNRFVLPGTDTERTEKILEEHFGQAPTGSFTPVAQGPRGSERRLIGPLSAAARRAAAVVPSGVVAGVRPAAQGVTTASVVTQLEQADAKV